MTNDGSLYFSSDREGGHGEGDIYRARLVDGVYLEPENIVNTTETAAIAASHARRITHREPETAILSPELFEGEDK